MRSTRTYPVVAVVLAMGGLLGGVNRRDQNGRPPRAGHMVSATSYSYVIARVRLETGSIWPAMAFHAAWNAIIQQAFDLTTAAAGTAWRVGESGILTVVVLVMVAVIYSRGTRTYIRRLPERGVPLSQQLSPWPAPPPGAPAT